MKWNTEEAGKRNQKPIHVEKCNKDINGEKGQELGSRYDYFSFCSPLRNWGNQESVAERTKKLLCQRVNGYE